MTSRREGNKHVKGSQIFRWLIELSHEVLKSEDLEVHLYVGCKESAAMLRLGSLINP